MGTERRAKITELGAQIDSDWASLESELNQGTGTDYNIIEDEADQLANRLSRLSRLASLEVDESE